MGLADSEIQVGDWLFRWGTSDVCIFKTSFLSGSDSPQETSQSPASSLQRVKVWPPAFRERGWGILSILYRWVHFPPGHANFFSMGSILNLVSQSRDPLFYHFWEQTSVFCWHGEGASIHLHRFREGTQRSKFSTFSLISLLSFLPCPTSWDTRDCGRIGGGGFLDWPPSAFSSLLNPLIHCFSSFQTSIAILASPIVSIFVGFWLFKNKNGHVM